MMVSRLASHAALSAAAAARGAAHSEKCAMFSTFTAIGDGLELRCTVRCCGFESRALRLAFGQESKS